MADRYVGNESERIDVVMEATQENIFGMSASRIGLSVKAVTETIIVAK